MSAFRTLPPLLSALLLVAATGLNAQDRWGPVAEVVESVRQELKSPGISVAVVIDDRLAWSTGLGLADVENNVPARANTVYRIASVSKPFGSIAVMQLLEQGMLSLDDPVKKYVPSFKHAVTIRQVMTHTSGIRHYKPGESGTSLVRYVSIADAIEVFKDDKLLFDPGTAVQYSSYAYNLLAGVVEGASGLPFERYLIERILKPAGMTQTHLEYHERIVPNRAAQYDRTASGELINEAYDDLSLKWTGGGFISSAEDLARLHIALATGKLLKPEAVRLMQTRGALRDGTRIDYSLAWENSTDEQGVEYADKYGSSRAYILRIPAERFAVTVVFNGGQGGNIRPLARRIANAVRAPATTH